MLKLECLPTPLSRPLKEREKSLLDYIRENGPVTLTSVVEASAYIRSDVYVALKQLREMEVVHYVDIEEQLVEQQLAEAVA